MSREKSFQEEQKLEIENTMCTSHSGQVLYTIQKTQVKIGEARLTSQKTISLMINDFVYNYKMTQTYKDVSYFQCLNRSKGESTNKKCLAKVHLDIKNKSLKVMNLHNPTCSEPQLQVNLDYLSQREDIHQVLSENPNFGVAKTLDVLREKNIVATPTSKRIPLNYAQVKKIIQVFKEDNVGQSTKLIDDNSLLSTLDGFNFEDVMYKKILFIKVLIRF